ncbi:MAG: hypothetical protein HZB33_14745 [Nitrospirae bacterium]|nr:hypothetical protein [Nitrospirota bacterium]
MDVTARTDDGRTIAIGSREYREVGLDLEGNERLGAWQIKEILDLSLQPGKKKEEVFLAEFPPEVKTAEIGVRLKYIVSEGHEHEVHNVLKRVSFSR